MGVRTNILLLIIFFICCNISYAKSRTETTGDILQFAIPAFALGCSYIKDDDEGRKQFLKASSSTFLTTEILKYTVAEERPYQKEDTKGTTFPSGHTSFAFSGASYLQTRYGYKMGIPAHLAASYVGYSRVYAKKHHWIDVFAGAGIGIGFNYLFTTPYKNKDYDIQLNINSEEVSLNFAMNF